MGRIRREFIRREDELTPKLFIITTEGTKTEPKYFNDLAQFYNNSKVHVEVLNREKGGTSPRQLISMLDSFCDVYQVGKEDELWIIMDRDKQTWTERQLSEVARLCNQKLNYFLGVSNPSFELWLILHYKDISDYSESEQRLLLENRKVGNRTKVKKELSDLIRGYNESNLNTSKFLGKELIAIRRARRIDNLQERWPNSLGTRVYLLVERIIV